MCGLGAYSIYLGIAAERVLGLVQRWPLVPARSRNRSLFLPQSTASRATRMTSKGTSHLSSLALTTSGQTSLIVHAIPLHEHIPSSSKQLIHFAFDHFSFSNPVAFILILVIKPSRPRTQRPLGNSGYLPKHPSMHPKLFLAGLLDPR
jgi:hypothetical protein